MFCTSSSGRISSAVLPGFSEIAWSRFEAVLDGDIDQPPPVSGAVLHSLGDGQMGGLLQVLQTRSVQLEHRLLVEHVGLLVLALCSVEVVEGLDFLGVQVLDGLVVALLGFHVEPLGVDIPLGAAQFDVVQALLFRAQVLFGGARAGNQEEADYCGDCGAHHLRLILMLARPMPNTSRTSMPMRMVLPAMLERAPT